MLRWDTSLDPRFYNSATRDKCGLLDIGKAMRLLVPIIFQRNDSFYGYYR